MGKKSRKSVKYPSLVKYKPPYHISNPFLEWEDKFVWQTLIYYQQLQLQSCSPAVWWDIKGHLYRCDYTEDSPLKCQLWFKAWWCYPGAGRDSSSSYIRDLLWISGVVTGSLNKKTGGHHILMWLILLSLPHCVTTHPHFCATASQKTPLPILQHSAMYTWSDYTEFKTTFDTLVNTHTALMKPFLSFSAWKGRSLVGLNLWCSNGARCHYSHGTAKPIWGCALSCNLGPS